MTEKELQRWLRHNGLADLWWVSVAGDVAEEPRRLDEAARIKSGTRDPVSVLHVSQAGNEDPPWILLEGESGQRSGRRTRSRVLLIVGGILLMVLVGGGYYIGTSCGVSTLFSTNGEEGGEVSARLPPLRVRVGRSDWLLYVQNGNLQAWPGLQVQLILGDKVWVYEWANTLEQEQTLQIPFRDFVSEHGRLDVRTESPERIRLIVEGYAEFEERMK